MLTHRVARAAHWGSLNQDAPTSDVMSPYRHDSSAPSRLAAAASRFALANRASDSPAQPELPRAYPVKGKPLTTQDAFHRIEKFSGTFVDENPAFAPRLEGFSATACAPIRPSFHHRPRQYLRAIPLSERRFYSG